MNNNKVFRFEYVQDAISGQIIQRGEAELKVSPEGDFSLDEFSSIVAESRKIKCSNKNIKCFFEISEECCKMFINKFCLEGREEHDVKGVIQILGIPVKVFENSDNLFARFVSEESF